MPDAPMLERLGRRDRRGPDGARPSGLAELTPAEMRVLRLLPSHLSYPQIAAELIVSPNTVKSQVRSVS